QAFANGAFSYEFEVDSQQEFYVTLEFHRDDIGEDFQLIFNDEEEQNVKVEQFQGEYNTQLFTLDASYAKSGKLKMMFKSVDGKKTPRIFGIRILKSLQYNNQIRFNRIEI